MDAIATKKLGVRALHSCFGVHSFIHACIHSFIDIFLQYIFILLCNN